MPVLYIVFACFLWSLTFIAPLFLDGFFSLDIVLGRFFVFGVVSIFFFSIDFSKKKICFKYWKQAAISALVINFGCFIALTLGIRCSSASIIALIIGMAPIVITIYECGQTKQSYQFLIRPVASITAGIFLVNIEALRADSLYLTLDQYLLGIFLGALALTFWCWYIISNTQFLQKNPNINSLNWTALIGVMSLTFSLIGIFLRLFTVDEVYLNEFSLNQENGLRFLFTITVLGLFSTWFAFAFWNRASTKLPSTITGQLAISETIFALLFIYIMQKRWPTVFETTGILCIVGGVWRGLVNYHKQKIVISQGQA